MQTTTAFKPGDRVAYVPMHKQKDNDTKDREPGIVTKVNDSYVFVRFENTFMGLACDPKTLIKYDNL